MKMKHLTQTFIAFLLMLTITANAQMVLEYNIDTPNTMIALPLAGAVNVNVNWGDSTAIQKFTTAGSKSHTFASVGTKTVTITGTMTAYGILGNDNSRLSKVLSWDGLGIISFNYAFYRAYLLTQVPTSLPPNVTDLSNMFCIAISFNQPIDLWNTASVTNMNSMFYEARAFNQPIGSWNTSSVKDMSYMFYNVSTFNQPIGSWNTAAVTNMLFMFYGARAFNQPIGDWNTGSTTIMACMFRETDSFNQPIGNWNTSKVTDMSLMFNKALAFNHPIGTWNTAGVTKMELMFSGALVFNQPIGTWNTSSVNNMSEMFSGAVAFDQPINNWNTVAVKNMSGMFKNSDTFNQPIGNWNTTAVTNMTYMFQGAISFNQPIGSWNTANVTNMYLMFSHSYAFNQPIGSWNTTAVKDMSYMFDNATAFNQPIGSWNVTNASYLNNMFRGAALCTENYDNLLNGWAPQAVKTSVIFDGGNSNYSSASTVARAALINKGWTITDAGLSTTVSNKCTITTIEDELNDVSITTLYPNPVKDKLSVHFIAHTNELPTYAIFNTTGTLVFEKEAQNEGENTEIEIGSLPKGLYVLKIKSDNKISIHSFVKE